MRYEFAGFFKCVIVEQQVNPFPGRELSLRRLVFAPLLAATLLGLAIALRKFRDCVFPIFHPEGL